MLHWVNNTKNNEKYSKNPLFCLLYFVLCILIGIEYVIEMFF